MRGAGVVLRYARNVGLFLAEGVPPAAEIEDLPVYLGAIHLGFQRVAVGLRRHRILGAVDYKHCGFDVALLRRHGGGEIAVQADHRADVGAGARKFQLREAGRKGGKNGQALGYSRSFCFQRCGTRLSTKVWLVLLMTAACSLVRMSPKPHGRRLAQRPRHRFLVFAMGTV
jgi:hypothetical protein